MGLSLAPLKRIGNDVTGLIQSGGDVIGGGLNSLDLGVANATGNQAAANNARAAATSDMAAASRAVNGQGGGPGQFANDTVYPILRPAAGFALGAGLGIDNAFTGGNAGTGQQFYNNSPLRPLANFATNNNPNVNLGSARQLFGNAVNTGVNAAGFLIGEPDASSLVDKVGSDALTKYGTPVINKAGQLTESAALGTAGNAASQYAETGHVNAAQAAKGGAATAGITEAAGIIRAAPSAVADATKATKSAIDNRAPLNEGGYIGGLSANGFEGAVNADKTFKGVDNLNKFEKSDADAQVVAVPSPGTNTPLATVLTHPTLYQDYPDLANVRVTTDPTTADSVTTLKPKQVFAEAKGKPQVQITIGTKGRAGELGEIKDSLLHEVQHVIQSKEGFAIGGGPRSVPEMQQAIRQQIRSIYESAGGFVRGGSPEDVRIKKLERLQNSDNILSNRAYKEYRALAGEVESRAVSLRSGLTQQQIDDNPFNKYTDTPANKQIVRYSPGVGRGGADFDYGMLEIKSPTATTGLPRIDAAIDDIAQEYKTPKTFSGTADDVAEQVSGHQRLANRLASKLGAVMKKDLTPEENEAVADYLDGHPTSDLTARAFKVGNALKSLYEQGFDVRQAIKEDIGKVVDYSPRVDDNSVRGSARRGAQAVKNLATRFSLSSGRSEARIKDKFTGSNGNVIVGNPVEHGLVNKGDGHFVDKDGHVYNRSHATKRELEAAGAGNYAHNESTNSRIYHGETLGLKAKAEAVNELATNPNAHGLYTKQQVDDGVAPKGVQEISGVKGLEDYYASPKDSATLRDKLGFNQKATSAPLRAYDAISNAVTQFIVLNPIFHGMNQLYQSGMAAGNLPGLKGLPGHGMPAAIHAFFTVNEDDMRNVLDAGAGGSTYGSDMENLLSKMTGGATKVSSKLMAAYELRTRAALYKVSIDRGMTAKDAARNINTFLGDTKHINDTVRRATLFAHYFRTMAKAAGTQLRHPIQQRGSIVNAATLMAMTAAISYGYQKATGNPNASVRTPGELGLLQEAGASVKGLAEGKGLQAAGVLTNRINPVLKEGAQQLFHTDLYTGQNISADRLGHAGDTLVAPAESGSKVTQGKRSIAETASNELGFKTPHAKGYQAAPKISELNTSKAITEKTGDPTGYQQQQGYFNTLAVAQKAASTDKKTAAQFADYLARSKDPVTGATIQNSPAESVQSASALFANDKLRGIVQSFEKSQPSHDPIWDLSASQLKQFEQYKAMYTGDPDKTTLLDAAQSGNDNWITDIENKENTYYNNLPKIPGAIAPEANAETPTYPVFSPQTTALLAQYDSADAADRTTLLQDNAEPLSSAFNDIANWTNAMRKAEGAPALQGYPEASPQVQAILDTYDALPKGNGPNGGSPDRSAWINANPSLYAQMSDYLTQASVYSLIKNASEAQFAGSTPDQQLLKDIKDVGSNDVATTAGTNGGPTTYELNPAAAFAQNTTNEFSSSPSPYTEARDAKNAAKAAKNAAPKNNAKTAKSSVKLKKISPYRIKAPKVGGKFKVTVAKPTTKGRISLKSTA